MNDAFRTAPAAAPPAPRDVTPDVAEDLALHGRFQRLFGGAWAIFGLGLSLSSGVAALLSERGAVPLPASVALACAGSAGFVLWAVGVWQKAVARRVFREGIEVPGEVIDVRQGTYGSISEEDPWLVVYAYTAEGKVMEGTARIWDEVAPRVKKGDRVVVLYAPGKPSRSVLWTRIDRGGEPAR